MQRTALSFLSVILFSFAAAAQDAGSIISNLEKKMNTVNDYSADVTIRSDIPLVRILPVRGTVYFRQKDKFRIVSKGIAILPKQGMMDMTKLLADKSSYTALISGADVVSSHPVSVITILPASDTSDLILAKLWIDKEENLVRKSQVTTRSSGTITVEYAYKSQMQFGLPDSMVFTVDVKKFKMPKGVATDINRKSTIDESKPAAKTGKIFISLTNYVINKGVSEDIFKK